MKTMQAELSNPKHSEYGVATIPFPIPDEEYDHVLELLEPLEIGDYVERDCQVDRLIGVPPILHRLEQTLVNLDELDFLIQRLDSFDYYEMEQFQALAYAKGVSNVLELINLTFNCQQVTVVGNFADLDAAGKQHYLTIHGGSASVEEYNRVDGRQESLNLLCNQEGKVTPYGVLYENALKMEQFYDGRNFPLYAYKPPVLEVTLSSNAGQELELLLPMPETRLERMLCRAGMDTAHVNLVSYESQLPDELDAAIDFETDDLTFTLRRNRRSVPLRWTWKNSSDAVVKSSSPPAGKSGWMEITVSPYMETSGTIMPKNEVVEQSALFKNIMASVIRRL